MSTETERPRTTVEELAVRFRAEMIPLTGKFSYFSTLPMADDDLRQYLNDPIAAIPPAVVAALPPMGIILAPYLEKADGKGGDSVAFERPHETRYIPCSRSQTGGMTVLAFGIKDIEVAAFHYQFYNALAALLADQWPQ